MFDGAIGVTKDREMDFDNTYVSALVNPHETKGATLLNLTVNNAIRRRDVGIATEVETWLSDLVTDHFTTQPIAYSWVSIADLAE